MKSALAWLTRGLTFAAALGAGYLVSRLTTAPAPRYSELSEVPRAPLDSLRVVRPGEDSSSLISRSDRPALILVFDVSCQHCANQVSAWRRVAELTVGKVEVIALSTSTVVNPEAYPLFEGDLIPYVGVVSLRRLQETLGLTGVPFTALVDEDNRLVATRQGVVSEVALRSLIGPHL